MNILHLSYSDLSGGAAVAATRFHKALLKHGIKSEMWCVKKISNEKSIIDVGSKKIKKLNSLKNLINQLFLKLLGIKDYKAVSLNIWYSGLTKKINKSSFDVIILHWINAETISCNEISKIKKPIIWVFHDFWPINGIIHYPFNITSFSKQPSFFLKQINKLMYNYKKRLWKNFNPQIVAVSKWLKECIEKSVIFENSDVCVIHNTINHSVFYPREKENIDLFQKINFSKKIILFGAPDINVKRKGSYLLLKALNDIPQNLKNEIQIVSFGMGKISLVDYSCLNLGLINNEELLSKLYSVADVMCVPSRQETFGQTASEAIACGTPVVAFNSSGLKDIIIHKVNGYLADCFSPEDFKNGIEWALSQDKSISKICVTKSKELFNEGNIVDKVVNLCDKVMAGELK